MRERGGGEDSVRERGGKKETKRKLEKNPGGKALKLKEKKEEKLG